MSSTALDVHRAYALLEVKAFDEQAKTFSGTATTATPDRAGDIIESLGVEFRNPVPLLLHHDTKQPIGTVMLDAPTAAGVTFTASLPEVLEPGPLQTRVHEAWQLIKLKILRGVSIGFRPVDPPKSVEFLKSGGVRFLKSEILELSLVSVPANVDATIHTIKSLDQELAASGVAPVAVPTVPASRNPTRAMPRKDRPMPKTIADQITSFDSSRTAKNARMTELMTKAADDGVTLDAGQTEEYDGLKLEVKAIDDHLVRLRDLEESNKHTAIAIKGTTLEDGSTSRDVNPRVVSVKDNLPPGIEFARYAMCLATAKGNTLAALEISKTRYPETPRIQTVLKAAVAAGTTTDPTWAGALVEYQIFTADFVEFLRPRTIIGQFGTGGIPSLRRVPFNIRMHGQTSGGSGYWVGQGKPKPLTKFDFERITLTWAKVANISVLTEETARFTSPSAEMLVRDGLVAALIERLDIDFIDPAKAEVTNVSPPSITNGITPLVSSGSDAAALRADIAALLGEMINANVDPTTLVWIMPATTALTISLMRNALGQPEFTGITMRGGTLMGIPVIASQYATLGGSPDGNVLILVNAADVFLADDGQAVIDVSREASLEMSDAPTNSSAPPTATSLVSLWQTNSIGLRAERFINWKRRRNEAVAYMTNVQYSTAP